MTGNPPKDFYCKQYDCELTYRECVDRFGSQDTRCGECQMATISYYDWRASEIVWRKDAKTASVHKNPNAPKCLTPDCGKIQASGGFCLACGNRIHKTQTYFKPDFSGMKRKEVTLFAYDFLKAAEAGGCTPEEFAAACIEEGIIRAGVRGRG